MARTSRKTTINSSNSEIKNTEIPANERIRKTAIYARLSSEDLGRPDGGTIENQILLVKKYIENKPYLRLCETFTDNGQTGTNFNREGFQNLMTAIKRGKIDCIVVKDLSRFGRDYIETGDYLEKILPFLGVRFISINDGYDSHDPAKSGDVLTVALKNFINDIYAKDISRKVKSAFEVKQRKGEYIGSVAPYGYLKDPNNRHKFIINEETAPVVRDMFRWKAEGMSNTIIARKLDEAGIMSPSNYLYLKGLLYHEKYSKKNLWSRDCVKQILKSPVYIGHMAQGKTKSDLSLGWNKKFQSKDNWIITENTHEPIIDLPTFMAANNIIKERNQAYHARQKGDNLKIHENIFTGLIWCSGCEKKLVRKKFVNQNKKIYARFVCPTYILHLSECCKKKTISEKNLKEIVSTLIRQQIDLFVDTKIELNKINSSPKIKNQKQVLHEEIQSIEQRLYKLNSLRNSLYDDFTDNVLTEKEYNHIREKHEGENNILTSRLDEISTELNQYSEDFYVDDTYAADMRQFINENELSRKMLTAFIEKIIIFGGNMIEIKFKYQNEFAKFQKYILETDITI